MQSSNGKIIPSTLHLLRSTAREGVPSRWRMPGRLSARMPMSTTANENYKEEMEK
jgi:hypothetical protein